MITRSNKILTGRQAIMDYLQMSGNTIIKFIKQGVLVSIIDYRYYSHTENLDWYFQDLTLGDSQGVKES